MMAHEGIEVIETLVITSARHEPTRERWTKEHAGSSQSHGARGVTLTALTTLGTLHDIAGIRARGDGRAALCKAIVRLGEACNAMRAQR